MNPGSAIDEAEYEDENALDQEDVEQVEEVYDGSSVIILDYCLGWLDWPYHKLKPGKWKSTWKLEFDRAACLALTRQDVMDRSTTAGEGEGEAEKDIGASRKVL